MNKARPSTMQGRSPTRRPSRVLPRWTPHTRSPFAERVWREATRRRFCQAPRRVVLGDGALWIWNIADDQFSDATQIVDRFHAKEHLSQVGKIIYGDRPEGKPWMQAPMMNSMRPPEIPGASAAWPRAG
jgi:hypothetical protein